MLQKRLVELSRIAYQRGIVTFSDFLNLNELNILHTTPKDQFLCRYETFGGYNLAERQIAAFLPDALCYEYEYPFQQIEITPMNRKFAEELTHRDYLGAIMNLGIERCKLADILTTKERAILFVRDKGSVASIRLDTILSLAYPLSRRKLTAYIEAGRVFVNGKLITSNGYRLKEGDMISVRKMGRISYSGILSETKKRRYMVTIRKYI